MHEVIARSFLGEVAPPLAETIVRDAVLHRVRAGELYMTQEERGRCGIVVSGLMRVFVARGNGQERTLREVEPGAAVGVGGFAGLPNSVNVQALVDSSVLDLDGDALTALAAREPSLAMALLREVTLRLRDTEAVLAAELGPIRQRLARRLLNAAATAAEPEVARIGHAALADQLACSREWITKSLAAFEREGLVAPEGRSRIRLLDPLRLHAVARGLPPIIGHAEPAAHRECEVVHT